MRKIKVNWNSFLKIACEGYPKEICAMLYARDVYSKDEEWFVFPVKNVSENPEDSWFPDAKEIAKLKVTAKKKQLIKIGNIHSHPYPKETEVNEDVFNELVKPSGLDLKYATKFRDFVRGIVLTNGSAILKIYFHDMYGNEIPIDLNSEDSLL